MDNGPYETQRNATYRMWKLWKEENVKIINGGGEDLNAKSLVRSQNINISISRV